jgi:hypothetical protein
VTKTNQILDLIFGVFLLDSEKALQEANKKLRAKYVIILVDSVQEPTVLENVQYYHRCVSLFAQSLINSHYIFTCKAINYETTELLLNVFRDLQKAHSNVVSDFKWKPIQRIRGYVQKGDEILEVFFPVRNVGKD